MSEIVTGKDALIARLEDENARLRRELAEKDQLVEVERKTISVGAANLRRQLAPLHKALQQIFGEIESLGVEDIALASPASNTARWDDWKARLGPSCAKVIDALLLGGEMTVKAIMTTAKMGQQTVYQATSKMGQAGIITKNGGKFSLKAL